MFAERCEDQEAIEEKVIELVDVGRKKNGEHFKVWGLKA